MNQTLELWKKVSSGASEEIPFSSGVGKKPISSRLRETTAK